MYVCPTQELESLFLSEPLHPLFHSRVQIKVKCWYFLLTVYGEPISPKNFFKIYDWYGMNLRGATGSGSLERKA